MKVSFGMTDYATDIVNHYKQMSGIKNLRKATTPFCPDGTLDPKDWESKGELSSQCCSATAKVLWMSGLSRPDTSKPWNDLGKHVSKWSINDDKCLYRLICYINSTVDFTLDSYVGDPIHKCWLVHYVD